MALALELLEWPGPFKLLELLELLEFLEPMEPWGGTPPLMMLTKPAGGGHPLVYGKPL